MSMFPDTPTMLLTRIAMRVSGEDESVWTEFFELYTPVMRAYLRSREVDAQTAEDIVQNVLMKLVTVLREGRYDKERSRFRTYLSRLMYHEFIDHYRRSCARREHLKVPLTDDAGEEAATAGEALDLDWAKARHREIVDHILLKTALSDQSKRVFRELEDTGDTCESVAKRMGLPSATVRQIKSRVGRMVDALERRLQG